MECHECPHSAEVAAGAYAEVPWEETPCAECFSAGRPGAVCLGAGKRHVPLDEARAAAAVPVTDVPLIVGGSSAPDDELPVSVLADALATLLWLPANVLEAIRLRYQGVRYREIARRLGIGRSACSMMVVRALKGHPVLAELMPRTKVRREARRGGGGAGENRAAGRRGPGAGKPRSVARAASGKRT